MNTQNAAIYEYLDNMKSIQNYLLKYIDNDDNMEENYNNLISLIKDFKTYEKKNELNLFLHFLSKIANNHQRSCNFFQKIEKILLMIKDDINKFFSNKEKFNFFKGNKRILLFINKNDMFSFDQSIVNIITNGKYKIRYYPQYFYPEIKDFLDEQMKTNLSKEVKDDFEEKRLIGENDNHICELIRKDLIDDYISLINNKNNKYYSGSTIPSSIFETNRFILKRNMTLISYATFYGSKKIFSHMCKDRYLLDSFLWKCSVHSNNLEMINILNQNNVKLTTSSLKQNLKESIKCHHSDFIQYFIGKSSECENSDLLIFSIQFYNFMHINNDSINQSTFIDLCQYDYISLVDILIKSMKIDINAVHKIKSDFSIEFFDMNFNSISNFIF